MRTRLYKTQQWTVGATSWESKYGMSFMAPRLVIDGSDELEAAAAQLRTRSVFVSWKHEQTRQRLPEIRALVQALAAAGVDCWWDKQALPPGKARSSLLDDQDLLRVVLDQGLRRSKYVLALGSPEYLGPSTLHPGENWTEREWSSAPRRLFWAQGGVPARNWPTGAAPDVVLPTGEPSPDHARAIAVAEQVAELVAA